MKRCYGCMHPIWEDRFCEQCGYDQRKPNAPHQLPAGTVLRDQYLIGRALGQGGFGITYLGWDINLDIPVAIKEYYPVGVVTRENSISIAVSVMSGGEDSSFAENRTRFLREAQTLAKLEDVPEVVQVKNFFGENNTAYIIMGYVKGITLQEYIRRRGGKLSVEETFRILMPIMEAMGRVHAIGLVHRDISPDNIMIQADGKPRLIDFGAAHEASGNAAKSTQAVLKHGYAPMEQYQRKGNLGPWTDIYAMCATVYACLTGKNPPHATDRMMGEEDFDWNIPGLTPLQTAALEQGTALQYTDRFQSMGVLRKALLTASQVPAAPAGNPAEPVVSETGTVPLRKSEQRLHTAPVEPKPAHPVPQPIRTAPVHREAPVQNVTGTRPAAPVTAKKTPWKAIVAIALAAVLILGAAFAWMGSGETWVSDSGKPSSSNRDDDDKGRDETQPQIGDMGEVAVFWYSFSDVFASNLRSDVTTEFEGLGIPVTHYDANFSQVVQIEQIQTAITKGSSALVVNMVHFSDDDAAQTIVELAAAAGLPVVFFNRPISEKVLSSYDKAAYVGTDYTVAARMQGKMVGDYVLENYDAIDLNSDGVISYVLFKGQEGNMEADARTRYSVEEAQEILSAAGKPPMQFYDPNNRDGYLVDGNGAWSAVQAQKHMLSLLNYYNEDNGNMVELIIANNDDMALGAVVELQNWGYNLPGEKCIPVFGIDGVDQAKDLIEKGAMTGTVIQDVPGQAAAIVKTAVNLAAGRDAFKGVDGVVASDWHINIPYLIYRKQ